MQSLEPGSIAALTLPPAKLEGRRWLPLAAAFGVHLAIAWMAWVQPASLPLVSAAQAATPDRVIELAPPPPPVAPEEEPPPTSPAPPAPPVPRAQPAPRQAALPQEPAASPPEARPPAPAAAGQVLARSDEAESLDFGELDLAVGSGSHFVGGRTASGGTNQQAVHGARVELDGPQGTPGGKGGGRSVGLHASRWDCPWPSTASALREHEVDVTLRVVVRPDGSVLSAELLGDPGHGFGEAALRCARSTRFEPALDPGGSPMLATSPPIRVHFRR